MKRIIIFSACTGIGMVLQFVFGLSAAIAKARFAFLLESILTKAALVSMALTLMSFLAIMISLIAWAIH